MLPSDCIDVRLVALIGAMGVPREYGRLWLSTELKKV